MAGKKGGQKKDPEARLSDLKLQFIKAKSFHLNEYCQSLADRMSSQLSRLAKALEGLEYQNELGTEALDLLEKISSDITKISAQEASKKLKPKSEEGSKDLKQKPSGSRGPATGDGSKKLKFEPKSEEGSKDPKEEPSGSKSQDGSAYFKKMEEKLVKLVAETRLAAIKRRLETTGHIRGRAIYRILVQPLLGHLERLSTAMVGDDQILQGNAILDLFERLYESILEIPPQGSEFERCNRISRDLEDLEVLIGRFVDAWFLNGRPQNIAGNGTGQILSHHLDSDISGNGNDYRARLLTMRQKLNAASRSGLIISRALVHQLSLQLQRMPETVLGGEDNIAQCNDALDLLEKLYEMATRIPPGDEEYAAGDTFHRELPSLVKCIDQTVDDDGLSHETVSVLEPEKITGNENVPDLHSELEASRKSEAKVQKKDSEAEDKGKKIREPLNRLQRVEKQVNDLHEMVNAQKESADQEKEKIQCLRVDVEDLKQQASKTATFNGDIKNEVNTIVKEANEKFKSKAAVTEIEALQQQLANLKSTEETLEKKMKELVSNVELQKVHEKLKNLVCGEEFNRLESGIYRKLKLELQKLEPAVQNKMKNLVCGEDLRKLNSEVDQKLKKLAYGFVVVLVLVVFVVVLVLVVLFGATIRAK